MTITNDRLYWIDSTKFFGMTLVVMGHMSISIPYLRELIYCFHMPLFVIISGFLFKPITFKQEFIRSFYCLIIPYLIYNIILVSIYLLIGKLHISEFKYIILGQQEMLPSNFRIMWFIITIFTMRCLFSLVHTIKYNTKITYLLLTILSICVTVFIKLLQLNVSNTDYFQLATTCLLLPFFIWGIYLKKDDRILSKKMMWLLVSIGIICVAVATFNGDVNTFRSVYGKSLILFYMVAVGISLLFLSVMKNLFNKRNSFVKTISMGTLLMIGFHDFFISILETIYPVNNILINLLYTCFIMLFFGGCIWICNKYFPILIGKYTPK